MNPRVTSSRRLTQRVFGALALGARTPADVLRMVRADAEPWSRSSVYRALNEMIDLGRVERVGRTWRIKRR